MSTSTMKAHPTIESKGSRERGGLSLLAPMSALVLAVVLAVGCGSAGAASTKGTGGTGVGGAQGCASACCGDDPQFPIQVGDGCVQCQTDADCMQLLFTGPWGTKCQPDSMCGCAVDEDCIGDATYPRCRTANATCVQCLTSADCDTTCNTSTNTCAPCSSDADCGTSAHGEHCSSGQCGCASSTDCASSPAGPTCTGGTCVCSTDADCTASSLGHACTTFLLTQATQCGCASDADCGTGSKCQTTAQRCFP